MRDKRADRRYRTLYISRRSDEKSLALIEGYARYPAEWTRKGTNAIASLVAWYIANKQADGVDGDFNAPRGNRMALSRAAFEMSEKLVYRAITSAHSGSALIPRMDPRRRALEMPELMSPRYA